MFDRAMSGGSHAPSKGEAIKLGLGVGLPALGAGLGILHGTGASIRNQIKEREKSAGLDRSLENLTNRSDQLRRAVKNRLDMRSIGLTKKPVPAASASKAVQLGRQTMSKAMSALGHI